MVTRIFVSEPPDNAEEAVDANETDSDELLRLDGTPRSAGWEVPTLELLKRDRGKVLKYCDMPPYPGGGLLILRPPAVEALGDLLRPDGELLPVHCEGAELALFNCTRLLDALDEGRSVIRRFKDGRIMMIESLELRAEALVDGVNAFKLTQDRLAPIYLSEAVVGAARAARLVRSDFDLVWEQHTA